MSKEQYERIRLALSDINRKLQDIVRIIDEKGD